MEDLDGEHSDTASHGDIDSQPTQFDFLHKALELARENAAEGAGGPFGAVVVKQGRIIATGVNLVTVNRDPSAHAEILAIRAACTKLGSYWLTDCELYSSCEPCPMCLGAIHWARMKHIFYAATRADAAKHGFDDAFIYEQFALDPEKRSLPTSHLDMGNRKAEAPFFAWNSVLNRRPY